MPGTNTIYYSQVDGIGYDADPSSSITAVNPLVLAGRSLKFSGSTSGTFTITASATAIHLTLSGNLLPNGVALTNSQPTVNQWIPANYVGVLASLHYRIPANVFTTIFAGGILRIQP